MRRLFILFSLATSLAAAESRTYDAVYVATLSDIPSVEKLDVWIPLPRSGEHQTVANVVIESPHRFVRQREERWGNEYAHALVSNPPSTIEVRVRFTVTRREAKMDGAAGHSGDLRLALQADRLVTLSPRIRRLAAEVTAGKSSPREQARAIYDHLLATMTYDKVVPGWGTGDTERACDIRKGNCTDFHSLFMSLARASGVPARFVIGFPTSAAEGLVRGYHCWAEFWLEGEGWVPVDASDASKNAKLRDYLFGSLDPERVEFTIGRDLVLTPPTAEPLNYFIHPYGEANGRPAGVPAISLEFKER
jgi:transglutaminase-like putative cysteine protease